jgi:hypothetical protein
MGDHQGDAGVNFSIEAVQFSFTLAESIEQRRRSGRDALGGGGSGVLGYAEGFNGAAD